MGAAVVVGECMVELSLAGDRQAAIGYAGDTFNTAVYLQRLGVPTRYATALGGDDPFSQGILALMREEGVSDDLVVRVESRLPGLYAIETDERGERRFHYWREASPARQLMDLVDLEVLREAVAKAPLTYVSAITLAILGEAGRTKLIELLVAAAKAGAPIALDTNYRARLWTSPREARSAVEALAPHCAYVSMSAADVEGLGLSAGQSAVMWARWGAQAVVRRDDNSIEVLDRTGHQQFAPAPPIAVVDTTGAGDAFNAGYLAARLQGSPVADAVDRARRLAGAVVAHRGAIIPRSAMP